MTRTKSNELAELGIETGVGIITTVAGMAIAGPAGALLGPTISPVLADFLKRSLTKREKDKIELVATLAINAIQMKLEKGSIPIDKDENQNKKAEELFEGVLLHARDVYEEKKLPLIANIFAVAPFTNTPVENLIHILTLANTLTYRQLCVLSIVGTNVYKSSPALCAKSYKDRRDFKKAHDEYEVGVYFDILQMINQGIMVQMESDNSHISGMVVMAEIIPQRLRLYGLGMTLFNSMMLDSIDDKDLEKVLKILR